MRILYDFMKECRAEAILDKEKEIISNSQKNYLRLLRKKMLLNQQRFTKRQR